MADPGADTAGGLAAPPPPPPQTKASDVGAPQTPGAPSRETADAESHPPAPPVPPPPQEQRQHDDTGKDEKEINSRQSRWPRVRSPVLWLLSLFRLRLRLQRSSQLLDQPKIPPPQPPEEDVPDVAAAKKDQGEGSKHRRQEASMSASEGCIIGDSLDARLSPMVKKLQNVVRLVKKTMSWYRRHRSPEKAEKPADEAEKAVETKPSTSPPEKKPHPRWAEEEARLENILEKACTRLVAAEFRNLGDETKRQCLLTFSVFALGAEVKKQAVTYWWATQFHLPSEKLSGGADDIFSELSRGGFLEPIKNRCSGVIHGCRVNPLVHWMVKHQAREKYFAELDESGNPADEQPKSAVLCLTAGNRAWLQNLRKEAELQAQAWPKSGLEKKASTEPPEAGAPNQKSQDVEIKREHEKCQATLLLSTLEKKRIILNISAHVYRLPEPLLCHFADQLEVLQLGRWRNSDDDTYMEVHALESLSAIGKLKNLRYLSLRGLSRLTELPRELRQLAILDVRGCQNLVRVSSAAVKTLKRLTHLDLTECYMLEHIDRGVSALSELQVFKGFVFGVGKRRGNACRLQDLAKLRKLRKLGVNVTTDSYVGKGEMAQLGKLAGLVSLTVTWGELPSILLDAGEGNKRLDVLLERWTDLELPKGLEKLDVRCYPHHVLPKKWFEDRKGLKKLYVRGGEVQKLDIPEENNIETLRLRYLNKFTMEWGDLLAMLNRKTQTIKRVEVVDMDQKVMRNDSKQSKDEQRRKKGKEEEERYPIKKRMGIPGCTLDEMGVWVRDVKEEALMAQTEAKEGQGDAKAEDESPNKEDRGDTGEVKNADGGDEKVRDMVKEEQGNKKAIEENGVQVRDEMKSASSPAPESGGDVEDGAGAHEGATDKSSAPELRTASQAQSMVPTAIAPRTEADNGSADVPEAAGKGREGDDGANDDDDNKGAEAEDEPANEEEDVPTATAPTGTALAYPTVGATASDEDIRFMTLENSLGLTDEELKEVNHTRR